MMRNPFATCLKLDPGCRYLFSNVAGITGYVVFGLLFCILLNFLEVPVLHAAETGLAQAKEAMKNREYEQAYEILERLFQMDPGNEEINFLLGRAAFENQNYEAAVMAFERVLIFSPDAGRVKLELARALYQLGSLESARQYFEEVLAANPPDNVRDNIQRYLKIIQSRTREHYFSGRLSLGVDFNTNANVAPASGQIDIMTALGFSVPVSVDRPVKDQIYNSTLTLNYVYKPVDSKLAWKASAVNYNAVYRDVQDLDINLFDLKAGIGGQIRNIGWECYALAGKLDLDYGGYQESLGVAAGFSFALNANALLGVQAKYRRKDYEDFTERDAHNVSLGISPVMASGPSRISLTLGCELENARDDLNSYNRQNAILAYERMFPYGITSALAYWYQRTGYDKAGTLFDKRRLDFVQYFISSVSKDIWRSAKGSSSVFVSAGYTYTRSDSDIELYEYTQNIISTSLSWSF